MVGKTVIQIEAAKPAIGEVQMHLFVEPPLRPNAEAIANQHHADPGRLHFPGGEPRSWASLLHWTNATDIEAEFFQTLAPIRDADKTFRLDVTDM